MIEEIFNKDNYSDYLNMGKCSNDHRYTQKTFSYSELNNTIETLKEKNLSQEEFLLNITHDLRAHLSIILSVMQCIDCGNAKVADEKAREYLKMIKRNSLKMLKLINNLIDTTKFQNNYYELNKTNIDIVSMIEGTINCIDKYAIQKNIHLIFDTNKEDCIMAVDPQVIDRIIMNLISNAIKFSCKDKNIYINLLINSEEVKISVKDEGPGISEDDKEKIFNRFYQVTKRKDSEQAGSGIGLDLVNYLTKAHGGSVILNSECGVGSEFIVTLPITKTNEKEIISQSQSSKIEMLEIEFSDIYL
ncbi:sensor histidine kinase [Clostridium gasigenes]|uniref:sensor histidine kinase n=1 Tax=Clostridium gasigenes TaxID=94869 RepID=UPI00209B48F2|nr:HAMP domain-containing sensor histidine kinase [Clostridium gasigenes]